MENQTDKTKEVKEESKKDLADRLETLATRLETANAETARLQAQDALGGKAEAGMEELKPEPISDIEFANKVRNGEINPLKEDGFI